MPINIENLKSQLRKGLLEYCVLLILDQKEVYASELIFELKGAKLIVVEGTIYPLLTRLKNDGALSYRWQESPSGPPRKYYSITPQGREALKILKSEWLDIASTVNHLIVSNPSHSSLSQTHSSLTPPPIPSKFNTTSNDEQ